MTKFGLIAAAALAIIGGFTADAATITFEPSLPTDPSLTEFGNVAPIEADIASSIQTYSVVYVLGVFDFQTVFMGPTDNIDGGGQTFVLAPQDTPSTSAVAVVPLPAALPLLGSGLLAFATLLLGRARVRPLI